MLPWYSHTYFLDSTMIVSQLASITFHIKSHFASLSSFCKHTITTATRTNISFSFHATKLHLSTKPSLKRWSYLVSPTPIVLLYTELNYADILTIYILQLSFLFPFIDLQFLLQKYETNSTTFAIPSLYWHNERLWWKHFWRPLGWVKIELRGIYISRCDTELPLELG